MMDRCYFDVVAPRKGRVDRNWKLSWYSSHFTAVAPRKGRVDRNVEVQELTHPSNRRAPQGARGLK